MAYYIGCSGYHYNDWRGKFYPEDLKKEEWLEYYTEHFNTVEINNTFYQIPEKKTLKEWMKTTPKDFRFAVKGSRYITHMKKLKDPEEHLDNFYEGIEALMDKTEIILWQLPGNLHKNKEKIENFCDLLNKDFKNVIEFRHKSWFDEEIYELLAKYDVISCSLSAPDDLPEELEDRTGTSYLRFHGKKEWYDYNYSKRELEKWSKKIEDSEAKDHYVYFNNDHEAHSAENAQTLKELLV
ncbi:MAG: DUF72 domain-containing protein [Bacteroidota bacterium]